VGQSAPHRAKNQQEALRLRDLQRHRLTRRVEVGHVEGGTTPHSIHDLQVAGRRSVCRNRRQVGVDESGGFDEW